MRRFVIADTHFGHKMLIDEKIRPADYDHLIIRRWHELVQPDDLVIHLGDVAIPDNVEDVWLKLAGLPGRKILVMGNHDNRSAKWYMERGFAFACDAFELGKLLFTHAPAAVSGSILVNLHGHLHEGEHRERVDDAGHCLVKLEGTDYGPVLVDKLVQKHLARWKRVRSGADDGTSEEEK